MNGNFPEIKRVCVFGTGGVGGYFGGRIAEKITSEKLAGYEVYFIARGEHLRAIQSRGLKVITPERTFAARPTLATGDVDEAPSAELFLLCVKAYDLEQAVRSIQPKVKDNTVIIPLMNGVDIYERIRKALERRAGIVLPACLYLGTHIDSPGVIDQNGGSGAIICGPDPRYPEYTGDNIKAFFRQMGLGLDWQADPYPAIWGKYIFIAAFGLVSAASGKSLGEIMENAEMKGRVRAIMQEITAIAGKKGIRLPGDIIEKSLNKALGFPYEARTSYQRDIERARSSAGSGGGGKNEGDLYGGTILREGLRLGIATPATEAVWGK
jgi:2-dehydropantoate 2-reductase